MPKHIIETAAGADEVIFVSPTGSDANLGRTAKTPKATFAAAQAALPSGRGVIKLLPGRHMLTAGITVDVSKQRVLGFPGTVLDFTGLSGTGTAVTATGTVDPPYYQSRTWIENVEIQGPGKATTGYGVVLTGTTVGPSHAETANITVHKFGTGIECRSRSYTNSFRNIDVFDCNVTFSTPSGVSDAGERISLTNSNLFNSNTAVLARNSGGEIHLINCSLDYNVRQVDLDNTQVHLYGCHVESGSPGTTTPDFKVAGNAGVLSMVGGVLLHNGTIGPGNMDSIVDNTAGDGAGAFFDKVHIMNTMTSTGNFSKGTGLTLIEGSTSAGIANVCKSVGPTANLLADGGFESATIVDDWYLTLDTVALTSATKLVGSNIKLTISPTAKRSGAQALRIEKVGGAGTDSTARVAVPIRRGSKPLVRLWYAKPGAETGQVIIDARFANLQTNPANGLPMSTKSQSFGTASPTFTSAAADWAKFELGEPTQRAPHWATHIVIEFKMFSFVGPGYFYVDDIEVTQI